MWCNMCTCKKGLYKKLPTGLCKVFYFYIFIDLSHLIYGRTVCVCGGGGTGVGGQRTVGARDVDDLLGGTGQSYGNDCTHRGNVPLQKTKPVLIAGAGWLCIIHRAPCGPYPYRAELSRVGPRW